MFILKGISNASHIDFHALPKVIMVAYYGIGGKFAKNAEQRKETIARITWVGVCLGIVILASSLVFGLKDVILGIS